MPRDRIRTVLLLNPPGRRAYVRDCYCSTEAKEAYYPHPLDLVVQSGILAPHFRVQVLDATAGRLSPSDTLRVVCAMKPDAVFFLTGSHARSEDLPLLAQIKAQTNARMIGSGDFLRFSASDWLRALPWLDGVCRNFVTADLARHLIDPGGPPPPNLAVRSADGEILDGGEDDTHSFSYPTPLFDRFPLARYRLPFPGWRRFMSVLSVYGCRAACTFCHAAALGLRFRPTDNLLEELSCLWHGYGIRHIFFRDPTFTLNRSHAEAVCEALRDARLDLRWIAWSRVDTLDDDLLRNMYDAGLRILQLGIEFGDQEVLSRHGKRYAIDRSREVVDRCRRIGIQTLGHFMLGLPGQDRSADDRTIAYATRLNLDYASFGVFEARPGTSLANEPFLLNGGPLPIAIPRTEAHRRRRRALRAFYLRPSQLGRRLQDVVRSPDHARAVLSGALAMIGTWSRPSR